MFSDWESEYKKLRIMEGIDHSSCRNECDLLIAVKFAKKSID